MGLVLFGLTVLIEMISVTVRYAIGSHFNPILGYILGYGPIALAIATLAGVPSGFLDRLLIGAREPSQRERDEVEAAFRQLSKNGVALPKTWYVVESPVMNAFVIGTTLYIQKALFGTDYLTPVLAHELGHLNSLDGRLVVALRQLIFPGGLFLARFFSLLGREMSEADPGTGYQVTGCLATIVSLFFRLFAGGLGVTILSIPWQFYFRNREFAADRYAAELGQAYELAETLDVIAPVDFSVPFLWGRSHPYTETRIDKLQAYARAHSGASAVR